MLVDSPGVSDCGLLSWPMDHLLLLHVGYSLVALIGLRVDAHLGLWHLHAVVGGVVDCAMGVIGHLVVGLHLWRHMVRHLWRHLVRS